MSGGGRPMPNSGGITLTDGNDDRIGAAPGDVSPSPDEPLTLPLELGLRIVERELRERARLYELLADR